MLDGLVLGLIKRTFKKNYLRTVYTRLAISCFVNLELGRADNDTTLIKTLSKVNWIIFNTTTGCLIRKLFGEP